MSKLVEFMEFVSKNDDARKELEMSTAKIKDMNGQKRIDVIMKLAAKYGFMLTAEDFFL